MSLVRTKLEDIKHLYKDKKVEKRKALTALEEHEPALAQPIKKKKTGKEKSDSAITIKDDKPNDENQKPENTDIRMEVDGENIPDQEVVVKPFKQDSKSKKKQPTSEKKNVEDKVSFLHLIIKNYYENFSNFLAN
jgi:hypothetical protein